LADFVAAFSAEMGPFESMFSKAETIEGMLGRFMMKFHILTRDFLFRRLQAPWDETVSLPVYLSVIEAVTLREWATLPYLPASYLAKPKAGEEKKKKARNEGAAPAAGGAGNTPRVRLQNTSHVCTALVNRFTAGGKELNAITNVAGVTPAYVGGAGRNPEHQICLSYHLRKVCFSEGCRCAASHRQLTTAEMNSVAQFLTNAGVP
jgi:hypothetical protein